MSDNKALALAKTGLNDCWDKGDVEGYVSSYADNAVWIVNTSPPAEGKEGITGMTKGLMAIGTGWKHYDLVGIEAGDTWTFHGKVDVTPGGKDAPVTMTFCDVMTMKNGKIVKDHLFLDTGPLSAA